MGGWVRKRDVPEGDLQLAEESVHPRKEGLGGVSSSIHPWLSFIHNHTVREVGGHDEIVLDDKGGLFAVHDEAFDHLFGVGGWVGGWVGK